MIDMAGCGLVNGIWLPWNTTITTSNSVGSTALTSMLNDIFTCLPWETTFIIVLFYIALYILFSQVPGRRKFIVNTLVPMIIAWIFVYFGWIVSGVADATTGIFIVTTFFVILTKG